MELKKEFGILTKKEVEAIDIVTDFSMAAEVLSTNADLKTLYKAQEDIAYIDMQELNEQIDNGEEVLDKYMEELNRRIEEKSPAKLAI